MSLRVLAPGVQTSVQDRGRAGFRHLGVTAGGVLDPWSLAAGNALLDNAPGAAALEFALIGPTLRAGRDLLFLLLGADRARLDGVPVMPGQPTAWSAGATLEVGPLREGGCGWLCVAGGIDVPVVLGSRSTDLGAGFGGFHGRALRGGDTLPVGAASPRACRLRQAMSASTKQAAPWGLAPVRDAEGPIRVLAGAEPGLPEFCAAAWRVSADSNRMGLRLQGPTLSVDAGGTRLSAGVAPGAIQLPPSGQPVVLLADAQTTGGYPLLGAVIRADLPRLARALAGRTLRFAAVTLADAEEAARARAAELARLHMAAAERWAAYS